MLIRGKSITTNARNPVVLYCLKRIILHKILWGAFLYGFRNRDNLISMFLFGCGGININVTLDYPAHFKKSYMLFNIISNSFSKVGMNRSFLNSHSHTVITFQPFWVNFSILVLSRSTFL